MRVKNTGICRGDGKIYMRLSIESLSKNDDLGIAAHGADGQTIPCKLYETLDGPSNEHARIFIAVLPVLTIRGKSISIFSKNNENERQDLPFSFERAKWESRLNYRINQDLCSEIRGYDKIGSYKGASIRYLECIPDVDANILRMLVTLPFQTDSEIRLSCFDPHLSPIDISPVVLGDTRSKSDVIPNMTLREIQLSVRLPKENEGFIFCVEDSLHPEHNSFNTLERHTYHNLAQDTAFAMMHAQIDPNYPLWFEQHKAGIDVLSKQKDTFFEYRPVYSIIVPLFNTPKVFFDDMIASVKKQSYGRWELILVNASPKNAQLASQVETAVQEDERIKTITLQKNLGISENTNAGIARSAGDFISFFDHDDLLEPDLLFEYTKAINEHDDIDVLYCDEDKLMPDGTLSQPFFKPCFNIDLLRDNNYICHMLTIRKDLYSRLKPNAREFDGAQDHNLTLQASEKARRIHHVAKVLYHWRISETSTAADADSKPYATQAGIKAVQAHLDRLGIGATVTQSRRPFTYQVTYDIPTSHPLVSIIIPTKDHADVLATCVNSIIDRSTYDNFEIVLVENNSTESETFEFYKQLESNHPGIIRTIYWDAEFNFSKLINFGAQHAKGDYLLLLNNDTEVITPDWIEQMLGICSREDVGIVGARLFYRDNTIQHAGVCVTGGVAGHLGCNLPRGQWGYFALADAAQDLSAVTAACMMTSREVFNEANGFTEELSVAFNDIDYCLKVRKNNHLVVYTPNVELYHYESLSRGYETDVKKKVRFHREISYMNYRWAEYYVKGDPYINENVSRNEPFNRYYRL